MSTSTPPVRRTRIVATIGPASRELDQLRALLLAGVDVCRINCSHASHEAIRTQVARIRRVSTELDRATAILLDLQGPKIRTGGGSVVHLESGSVLRVHMDESFVAVNCGPETPAGDDADAGGAQVGTTWPTMAADVQPGERVLFADGALSGVVVSSQATHVDIRMQDGGNLGTHKGINLPDTAIRAPALTEKDRGNLAAGIAAGVDYVALSFVRTADDIRVLRQALAELGAEHQPVIAKIEKPQAVDEMDEILAAVEGVMVARGDLGVEMPLEVVPVVQKEIIERANNAGVLVITATQMLDSMERNPRPTRAETTDVANAILDGTDAVMLSGETAAGRYPVEAVSVMDRIAREVERSRFLRPPVLEQLDILAGPKNTVARAACYAVREQPRPLVVFTWSGSAAIAASKSRPPLTIYALTPSATVRDRLSLVWGVHAVLVPEIQNTDALIAAGETLLMDLGLLEFGDEVVVLAGKSPLKGVTNIMKVEVVDGV